MIRSKEDMMILVNNCGGAVAWHPDMDVRCGVRTARLPYDCTVRGERRADGERFCFTSRSWFGVCIAKISPKKLGDYNCLITGI